MFSDLRAILQPRPLDKISPIRRKRLNLSASVRRLPKLDAISFRVAEPAKLSEIIAFAFGIDGDTFGDQTVQHSIEVIHLEIDHGLLCGRKICIVVFEEGEDDPSALRRGRKRVSSLGLHQTDMSLVPAI